MALRSKHESTTRSPLEPAPLASARSRRPSSSSRMPSTSPTSTAVALSRATPTRSRVPQMAEHRADGAGMHLASPRSARISPSPTRRRASSNSGVRAVAIREGLRADRFPGPSRRRWPAGRWRRNRGGPLDSRHTHRSATLGDRHRSRHRATHLHENPVERQRRSVDHQPCSQPRSGAGALDCARCRGSAPKLESTNQAMSSTGSPTWANSQSITALTAPTVDDEVARARVALHQARPTRPRRDVVGRSHEARKRSPGRSRDTVARARSHASSSLERARPPSQERRTREGSTTRQVSGAVRPARRRSPRGPSARRPARDDRNRPFRGPRHQQRPTTRRDAEERRTRPPRPCSAAYTTASRRSVSAVPANAPRPDSTRSTNGTIVSLRRDVEPTM